jgi:hypothetical protein
MLGRVVKLKVDSIMGDGTGPLPIGGSSATTGIAPIHRMIAGTAARGRRQGSVPGFGAHGAGHVSPTARRSISRRSLSASAKLDWLILKLH